MVYVFSKKKLHDGCIVRYGAWGGTSGTYYFLIYMGADHDDGIAQGMNYKQWIHINHSHPTTDF